MTGRKYRYTIHTDAAIDRINRSLAAIIHDLGTTGGEKFAILREIEIKVQELRERETDPEGR
jgi:hypothetical protein